MIGSGLEFGQVTLTGGRMRDCGGRVRVEARWSGNVVRDLSKVVFPFTFLTLFLMCESGRG